MAALRRSPSSQVSRSVVVKSLFSYLAIWSEEPRLIDHCAFARSYTIVAFQIGSQDAAINVVFSQLSGQSAITL
jgi:hypothetical protein